MDTPYKWMKKGVLVDMLTFSVSRLDVCFAVVEGVSGVLWYIRVKCKAVTFLTQGSLQY